MIKFIIPFYYTFQYNRKGFEGLAYLLEYYVFSVVSYMVYSVFEVEFLSVILLLVSTTLVYELGYIHNNVFAIKTEKSPTIRHDKNELIYIEKNLKIIMLSRIFIFLSIIFYFFLIDIYTGVMILALSSLMLLTFYLYNITRKGWKNRGLFFLLRFFRYCTVLILLGLDGCFIALIISIINFINNLSWYKNRTKFSLPRFFGTKLFDSMAYLFISLLLYLNGNQMYLVFSYLAIIKIVLFTMKYIESRLNA